MTLSWLILTAALIVAAWPRPASAYIGPEIGLGALGAAFGIAMTSLSAMFYFAVRTFRKLWQRVSIVFARRPDAEPGR